MWYEIIRWISIGICWVATAINVYACVINLRNSRKLSDIRKIYVEELKRLTESEK